MQLQVMCDCFLVYIDSVYYGHGTFLCYMEEALEVKGVLNIATEQGSGKRQADVLNMTFIPSRSAHAYVSACCMLHSGAASQSARIH